MDDSLFGEGLTLLGERLFQLTWSQNFGFIYDQKNLSRLGTFNHEMKEGWGLATDGKVLFGSDGSSTLYRMDPQTFKAVSKEVVYYKGHQVQLLNELEYVNGEIWANVYMVCLFTCSTKIIGDNRSLSLKFCKVKTNVSHICIYLWSKVLY
ncbi:hypothetical protein TanjilG_15004 [Lupinus angustifolius]|uniref:Glutaminyl-peptide cyclotransferase n=1 Tax=Lupinus angustifolius TaxID=3871 RepID=A0A4P1RAM5_LUPAN|nr:hypothetical protein TanjilG_15004 [Lupinus angustifolius]